MTGLDKKPIKILFILIGFTLILGIPGVLAANDTDTIVINVSVQDKTEITILQNILNWTNVNPGSASEMQVIDVKNVGSTNVTGIYGYVDAIDDETSNPTGSDDPQVYAAGSVLTLRRNESGGENYFAGRLEWNYTDSIELITLPDDAQAWGWFKNTSYEYTWALANGTDGTCNETGSALYVNKYSDNGTSMTREVAGGSYSDGGTFREGTEDWGLFDSFPADSPWNNYCLAAFHDCTKLYVYKYDRRPSGNTDFDGCLNSGFLNTTNFLGPGELQKINLNVWMPYGMPEGNLLQATLTIFATE